MKLHLKFISAYKKNTCAILLSFTLIIGLMTAMLVLINTNHRLSSLQDMLIYTPADIRIKNLDKEQTESLKKCNDISKAAIAESVEEVTIGGNKVFFQRGNDDAILMTCKLAEGHLPESENEIVAERWALLNMNIPPVLGQKVTVAEEETGKEKEYTLVGILSDVLRNKQVGLLYINSMLQKTYNKSYVAYINFKEETKFAENKEKLTKLLQINSKELKNSPGKEYRNKLYMIDIGIMCIILMIGMVIFSGIYRISILDRENQYGILRSIGIKKKKLKILILQELFQLYLVSVPLGICFGGIAAKIVMKISGDENQVIYLYGKKVNFELVIPAILILFGILLFAVMIAFVAMLNFKKLYSKSIIASIYKYGSGDNSNCFTGVYQISKQTPIVLGLGFKYLIRDFKTSIYTILTICLGVSLFHGLYYQAAIAEKIHYETSDMYYLNGEYTMNTLAFQTTDSGVSRESVGQIKSLDKVSEVETASGLPIRVIEDPDITRNEEYYDDLNTRVEEARGYSFTGNDGKDSIYKSVLYGYNKNALKKMKKYIVDGDFSPDHIEDDEIIVCVMREAEQKMAAADPQKRIGWYQDGEMLMEYRIGDEIRMKYRQDFDTNGLDYAQLTDDTSNYIYKNYKVIAIVSFPYLFDSSYSAYPLFITSDENLERLAPASGIQSMYINGADTLTEQEQIELERELISIGAKNHDITTRSLMDEKQKADMLYQKQLVYIYGIAFVFLVLAFINISNNLKYRLQTRKAEISIYRGIGMKMKMIKQMIISENCILAGIAILIAYGISCILERCLYTISEMKAYGYSFIYDQKSFLMVSIIALLICIMISEMVSRELKGNNIMEFIDSVE